MCMVYAYYAAIAHIHIPLIPHPTYLGSDQNSYTVSLSRWHCYNVYVYVYVYDNR